MNFTDVVSISGTRRRSDGYLVVDARIARTGLQRYLGSEVGRPDREFVTVYRPEGSVFSDAALASFAHRPITVEHPSVAVTADNWKSLAVGQSDGEVKRDGDYVRVPLMIADRSAIERIEAGKRELSAGYTCDLDWTGGTTPAGETYDAVQTNIRANHIAIVDRGRAGPMCRIGDGWTTPATIDKETKMTTRTVMVDGLSVETTDQGAQAIEKLTADRRSLNDQLAAKDRDHATAMATKDAELSKLQAQLDDAKSKILDQAAIDARVAARVALEATALRIAKDVKPAGLSDVALKQAVVKTVLGDRISAERLADAAYVGARFDILAEDAAGTTPTGADPFRDALRSQPAPAVLNDAQAARQKAFDDLLKYDQTGSTTN